MLGEDLLKGRIVDLSYEVIPPGTQERPFAIKRGLLADNAFKHEVTTHTHVGTHVEVPAHFFEGGKEVTDLPLDRFFGRAVVLDVPDATEAQAIGPQWLEKHLAPLLRGGDIVLCRNSDNRTLQPGSPKRDPGLSVEGAQWLRQHGVKMVGIDGHFRFGDGVDEGRAIHAALLSADICLIEFLDNLAALRKKEFFFLALPFKARGVDSAWARALAIEEP